METTSNSTKYGLWGDLHFILRIFRQWCFAVVCVAIVVGILGYVASDLLLGDTYTATATVAVVPKDNTTSALSTRNVDSAVTRNLSMWNSSILIKTIQDENPDMTVKGTLTATEVTDSGLISLTATAGTAENAYYLLSSAVKYYHKIDSNFDKSYTAVMMTRVTGDNITVSHKRPILFGVAGFALMLVGCFGILLLWALFTDVLHNEEQAKQLLEVPLYESLISVNKKKLGIKTILITQDNCDADYLEGMDKLTSRVEQHMHNHRQHVVMVTSIQENEGKSTVAANLALNLARRGSRTLLMDLDLRRPVMYRIFDHEKQESGSLSRLLQQGADLTAQVDHRTDLYDLDILWQYRPVRDSDRMLEKLDLASTLQVLSRTYDYIVIDTPPMGPVRDGEVIARSADCSLLVVRQDFSRAAVVNDVTDQLQESGAPCMGAVLNNCKAYRRIGKKSGYGGYGYGNAYRKGADRA